VSTQQFASLSAVPRHNEKFLIRELVERAQLLRADVGIGADIDYDTVGGSMPMVTAAGAAVKLG
jgi:uncharacterized protein YbjQ (UPF0145 family)